MLIYFINHAHRDYSATLMVFLMSMINQWSTPCQGLVNQNHKNGSSLQWGISFPAKYLAVIDPRNIDNSVECELFLIIPSCSSLRLVRPSSLSTASTKNTNCDPW